MKHAEIDKPDKIILKMLQAASQQPLTEIAAKAGLSPSTCHRRIKAMEEQGLITGYTATLDRKQLGFALNLRHTPALHFVRDTVEEKAERVSSLLEKIEPPK